MKQSNRFCYAALLWASLSLVVQGDPEKAPESRPEEMVIKVKAKKRILPKSSTSKQEVTQERIRQLPQGDAIPLPKLISTTTPGVVPGAFGQLFIRGNHANIQYRLDGIQLPDSPSNTFGEVFSARNIDKLEVITGGVPAEFGQRLGAVINIASKTGPLEGAGKVELNYGSYRTFSPFGYYGGSSGDGSFHYFLSANYGRTDRGLDTPAPESLTNPRQGSNVANHDGARNNNQFGKFDWQLNNEDKLTAVLLHSYNFYEIPTFPSSFRPTDPIFQANYTDAYGNGPVPYTPATTNDTQAERNAYLQLVWKHTFDETTFLQVGPFVKYSTLRVVNDPTNDLSSTQVPSSSFSEDKHANNYGLKVDLSLRPHPQHAVKTGVQFLGSRSEGNITVISNDPAGTGPVTVTDNSPSTGYFESAYVQDDYALTPELILNVGLRFDAVQFKFGGTSSSDSLLQPRLGLSYALDESTKVHAFYGKLFQPAPVENLRSTFTPLTGVLAPYDIKAEKDDYVEAGVMRILPGDHAVAVTGYYKWAKDMLDDAQLLNTSIAQPYNFQKGYAYGVEVAVNGNLSEEWTDFLNYSFVIAKGRGISGGIFAFNPSDLPGDEYQYLDHVQVHTFTAGTTYTHGPFWWSFTTQLGGGLRTGPNNTATLPAHLTFDSSVGYEFKGESWWSRFKVSGDVLNILDNAYPISLANGFNGNHYAAGRQFFARLTKEF
jgi:outer membrane receptor for ferrienterochelin and colicin